MLMTICQQRTIYNWKNNTKILFCMLLFQRQKLFNNEISSICRVKKNLLNLVCLSCFMQENLFSWNDSSVYIKSVIIPQTAFYFKYTRNIMLNILYSFPWYLRFYDATAMEIQYTDFLWVKIENVREKWEGFNVDPCQHILLYDNLIIFLLHIKIAK